MTGTDNGEVTTGATWSSVYQSLAAGGWTNFRTAISNLPGTQAPFSLVGVRYTGKDTTIQYPFVISLNPPAVHPRVDSQRRRLGRELT
jgi:hypothetical protein